jgi:hypothetical protein
VDDDPDSAGEDCARSGRGRFRSDQSVRAAIVYDTVPSLMVPVIAVTRINGQFFVFVVDGTGGATSRVNSRDVGQVIKNEYVVRSGKPGERLIVSGIRRSARRACHADASRTAWAAPPASAKPTTGDDVPPKRAAKAK